MSYIPPSGNAANFAFSGGEYVAPNSVAANFSFLPLFITTSFGGVSLGTPSVDVSIKDVASIGPVANFGAPVRYDPSIASTFFGTPIAAVSVQVQAWAPTTQFSTDLFGYRHFTPAGFLATNFGTARLFPAYPSGWNTTGFGTPYTNGGAWLHVASQPTTVFSTAYYAFAQVAAAVSLEEGFFGLHRGDFSQTSFIGTIVSPEPIVTAQFGKPTARFLQIAAAGVWEVTTSFNAGAGALTYRHAGFSLGGVGAPTLNLQGVVLSVNVVVFGVAKVVVTGAAGTFKVSTAFGAAEQKRGRRAYGFCSVRFSGVRGFSRFGRNAAGFCTSSFGSGLAKESRRVATIAPVTNFSTPLMRRNHYAHI